MDQNKDNGQSPTESSVSLDSILNVNGGNFDNLPLTPQQPPKPDNSTVDPPASQEPATEDNQQQAADPNIVTGEEEQVETFETLITRISSDVIEDPADQSERDHILSTFKGTKIDDKGNVLNDKGEIVVNTATLKNYLETDTLPLNENGDLINDKGEVIKSKDDLLKESSVILQAKAEMETSLGVTLPDDIEFPDTIDGIVQLAKVAAEQNSRNAVINFLEQSPQLKAFYQHLALGNSPETFNSNIIDYRSINIKELSEDKKVNLLKDAGNTETVVAALKSAGEEVLNKAVAEAVLVLDAKQTETSKARDLELQAARQAEQEETTKYWNEAKKLVSGGKIGNITIPSAQRDAFFDYMAKPVNKDGYSAEMIDSEKDSMDFTLLVSYLRFVKGDVGKLAQLVAQQQRTALLSDRFKRDRRAISGEVTHNANSNNNGESLTLDSMFK